MHRLVVVPTPIGNLDDITLRALRELQAASLVLAEDTRHTGRLFAHFNITTRLVSYHQHNKRDRLAMALAALQEGDVALVSSAGMPSISDPGFELVQAAIEDGAEIDVLPGASAITTAVVGAALPAPGFLFLGFLPRKAGDRRSTLAALAGLELTLVFFEAPHRVAAALSDMLTVLGDRNIVVARELTKVHQEWVRGTITEVHARYSAAAPKGEMTLVVSGAAPTLAPDRETVLEHLRRQRARGLDRRAAFDATARSLAVSRNLMYPLWLEIEAEHE